MKMDELKPVDKAEPIFDIGEWIIRIAEGFKHNTYLIKEIKDYYVCEELKGRRVTFTFNDVHKNFKLWDISDAKDGDLLVASDGSIFLFAGVDDCACKYYAAFTTDNYVKINKKEAGNGYWESSIGVHPATKEQRDLFFSKIKESGWDWDSEKKELNRIEQNPVNNVKSKFKIGDYIVPDNITSLETWKVINIDKDGYYNIQCITNPEYDEIYRVPGFILEKDYRLWSINDAKAGDVLAANCHEGDNYWEKIIIFVKYHNNGVKGWSSTPCVEGYGNTFKNGKLAFEDEEIPYYSEIWTANLHPATKEQCNLLLQTMKEVGYEFNVENKELRKQTIKSN